MSTAADVLSVRLARLACQVDEVALSLEREPMTATETVRLSAAVLHLAVASDAIEQTLHRLEHNGQSPANVEPERIAA